MDCAKDRLSSIRELTQEANKIPRGLAVETRGGFIEEEK